MRNLDLTALRSFVAVVDVGGMTRAANLLNLTQSAVSMQIKRLEDSLDVVLLTRAHRTVTLTVAGEQLLGYARRLIEINDQAVQRLTDSEVEGELRVGVPHDIVYPCFPMVLQRLNAEFPRVRVNLVSSYTLRLRELFGRGECDLILTTEDGVSHGGAFLAEQSLLWVGAPGAQAWRDRPLRLAFEHGCMFRAPVQAALDSAGIAWEMAVDSDSARTIEAAVSADLAVTAALAGTVPAQLEAVQHGGALPPLGTKQINIYVAKGDPNPARDRCVALIRCAYAPMPATRIA